MASPSSAPDDPLVRTYDRVNSVVFLKTREAFGGLSNMASGFPLEVNGLPILTAEALYQACRFPHRPEVQRLIITQASPMTAKMKGKPYRRASRPDWERVRVRIMRWCLRVKLAQNWAAFSLLLLETGEHSIVEESRRDAFWGARATDGQTLVGANVLGRLLMELREAIKTGEQDSLLRVEPLPIAMFLLDGRPIQALVAKGAERSAPVLTTAPAMPLVVTTPRVQDQASLFDQPGAMESPAVQHRREHPHLAATRTLSLYPAMKDSGVERLGKVPGHWDVRKLRSVLGIATERNRSDLPLLSVVREKGVILRDVTSKVENHNFIPEDLTNYKVVHVGQFAMNKMKAWQGSYGVSRHDGAVSPAYFVFDIRGVEGAYFHVAVRSNAYVPFFTQASDGVRIGQWDLSKARMKEIRFLVPPLPEQSAIVRFLDHMDRRIRRYIRAKQKLIKLLEEQKQAIIHRAVTRGLDPSICLKPSGVEWLGDVPEHWEVVCLGRLVALSTGFPFKSEGFTQSADDARLLRGVNISPGRVRWDDVVHWPAPDCARFAEYELEPGDIVLGMDRPIILGGVRVAVVRPSDVPSLLLQRVARIRPNKTLRSDFLHLLLAGKSFSDYLSPIFTGISVPHLSPEQIKSFRMALPGAHEQGQIVQRLAIDVLATQSAMDRARREITLLREYHTRLIADVVTGKLDVREAAASLADEAGEPEPLDDAEALAECDVDSVGVDPEVDPEEVEA